MVKKASLVMMTLAMCCITAAAGNNATKGKKAEAFNWNPIMDAIIQVESEGNPNAVSGNSVGVMQITPILVKECNNILEKQKSKKRFKMDDRYSEASVISTKRWSSERRAELALAIPSRDRVRRSQAQRMERSPLCRALPCKTSITPHPLFIRRGFRPLSKPLANLWQEA